MKNEEVMVGRRLSLFFLLPILVVAIQAIAAQEVTIPSQTESWHGSKALLLPGILRKPSGNGQFPVAVMFSGFTDSQHESSWVDRLTGRGYVALESDSLSSRRFQNGVRDSTDRVNDHSISLPALTLKPGNFYFSLNGRPSFIFSRNVAGYKLTHYYTFLDWAKAGGSKFIRIQLDSMGMGYTSKGGVDHNWVAQWDKVFDKAREDVIYILPVFSGWFDWNAGAGYSTWKSNPMNYANGGPVKTPAELFQKGSATQIMWLDWMQTLVKHWKRRKNIFAWEVFSEVNLASGVNETTGIEFVNSAVKLIRIADPSRRPVTASLADTGNWPNFYRDTSIDFINIHPYPPSMQLDKNIILNAGNSLARYNRPVLIGESGLSFEGPNKYPPKAEIGVRHAIWAAIVSGAMNGRALYWEDSFAIYFSNEGMPFVQKYSMKELPSAEFVKGVDFSGFEPLKSSYSSGVWGAAIGNDKMVLGWFRDSGCEPPNWHMKPLISKQTVTITLRGKVNVWRVDFYDTKTGVTIINSTLVTRNGQTITIPLPDFQDDIAFKAYAEHI